MNSLYNRFAGQSLDRIGALSDGIFAVAMTLLVLNLHVPTGLNGSNWGNELLKLVPSLVTYLMSFLTLGIFWVGQQTQLSHFTHSSRDLAWIHLGFLLAVSLVPFSTALLASNIDAQPALVIYWLNILLLGVMLYWSWRYGLHAELVSEEVTTEMRASVERRIIAAQAIYACGALLCFVNTRLSIVVIILAQLNYAIAPRIRVLYRL